MEFEIIVLIVILAIILIGILYFIGKYNKFIRMKNKVSQARQGIDVYLKQRFDLIPNLVECVKEYSKHEKELLENVIILRNSYDENKELKQGEKVNKAINKIIAVAESYPELKASENYLKLQKSLIKTESQLQAARRIYNNAVTKYNTEIQVVPGNIIAGIFSFKEEELFDIDEEKISVEGV